MQTNEELKRLNEKQAVLIEELRTQLAECHIRYDKKIEELEKKIEELSKEA